MYMEWAWVWGGGDVNTGMITPSGMCLVLQSTACVCVFSHGCDLLDLILRVLKDTSHVIDIKRCIRVVRVESLEILAQVSK